VTGDLDLRVRELRRGDVGVVAALVAGSFDAGLTPYMVATQAGWARFLDVVLSHPESFPTHRLTVVEREGRVVAFADYRVPGPGQGFLSYICVDPAARATGIGRRLFVELLRRHGPVDSVSLDVFAVNASALALYASMGFHEVSRQEWWRAPVPAGSEPLALDGLTASLASLATYGFCEVSGERDGRPFRFGRMGGSVLRAFSADDYDDADLVARLAATFPELREIFAVLPAGHRPRLPAESFNTAIRMTADEPVTGKS
jgi:ribosomal protein S18 acetylase RimI-like enzyme